MGSLGSAFAKKRCCPSSDILLSYHRSYLSSEQTPRITSHLATCDFCAAELQLLSKYPSAAEPCGRTVMPPDLGALAAMLLTKDNLETEALLFQIYRNDTLALTLNRMNPWPTVG
jgi:hypothetical protein